MRELIILEIPWPVLSQHMDLINYRIRIRIADFALFLWEFDFDQEINNSYIDQIFNLSEGY